jgi:hypothetical protein
VHWDGSQWHEVVAPKFDDGAVLWDAAAIHASDLVSVGAYWDGPYVRTLVLHWDGSTWSRDTIPSIPVPGAIYPPASNQYLRCAASADDSYWASGELVDASLNLLMLNATTS